MSEIKFAALSIKKNFQNAKELKSAFITSIIGMCINNISFTILWFYFGKTMGNINGWDAYDIFLLYAFSTSSYGIVNSIFYGINNIPNYISSGNFDKYLLTPKNVLLKVCTSAISTSAIGDFIFGIICFGLYCFISHLTVLQIIVSILLLIITSIITFAFTLICMSISFYLMDGENVSTGFKGMFISVTTYHGGAFTGILRLAFVFLVPALLVGAIPVEIIKNITVQGIIFITVIAIIWLLLSILFFYKSLRKYESNNFFGFGG